MDPVRALGIDHVEVLAFDADMAAMSADEFVEDVLHKRLKAERVVIGHGFPLRPPGRGLSGHLRSGGLSVDGILPGGRPAAGLFTRIRSAVAAGDVALAAGMLGRSPEVEGVVEAGQKRDGTSGSPPRTSHITDWPPYPRTGCTPARPRSGIGRTSPPSAWARTPLRWRAADRRGDTCSTSTGICTASVCGLASPTGCGTPDLRHR